MIQFLTDIYSEDNLSMRGLRISSDPHHANVHNQHEVAIDWVMRKKEMYLGWQIMAKDICTVDSGNSELGFVTNFVY